MKKRTYFFNEKDFSPTLSPATTIILFLCFPSLPTRNGEKQAKLFFAPNAGTFVNRYSSGAFPFARKDADIAKCPTSEERKHKSYKEEKMILWRRRELFFPEISVHESIFYGPQPINSQISNSQLDKRGIFLVYIAIFQTYK